MDKNILLALKKSQQNTKLKNILTSHGFKVAAEADDAYSALRILRSQKIALSLLSYDLTGLNGMQLAKIITDERLGPVVILTQRHIETNELPAALFGILMSPIKEYQLINSLNLAISQYKIQQELEKEVIGLKDALENRKIIEKAKGILMAKQGLSEDLAFKKLRKASMEKRIPMKEVAQAIILLDEI